MSVGRQSVLNAKVSVQVSGSFHTVVDLLSSCTSPLHPQAKLSSEGSFSLTTADGSSFTLTSSQVEIKDVQEKQSGRNFTPNVIEPSFGIGRIMYCMFEHCYYLREVGSSTAVEMLKLYFEVIHERKTSD